MTFNIECIAMCDNHVGESPIWDSEQQCLYWVDSTGRRVGKPAIWRYDPRDGNLRSWMLDQDVGALALRQDGGAVLALSDGFYAFDFASGEVELIVRTTDDPERTRLNDGKCDRRGRFFAGGMDDKEELGVCGLWRLDPDFSLAKVEDGIICSNGPCWSPDNKLFYFADTFTSQISVYDYDIGTGAISGRRLFTSLENELGFADGSTVDAEGCVWNAQVVGGDLVRYAPDGEIERRIGMPVKNITSVAFGGKNLDEIFVTSLARVQHPATHDNFIPEAKPQYAAGGLFRITGLGIRGLPEPRFGG